MEKNVLHFNYSGTEEEQMDLLKKALGRIIRIISFAEDRNRFRRCLYGNYERGEIR